MYLICEARPLADQYECDAEITPIQMTKNLDSFLFDENKYYEIWKVLPDGGLTLMKEWYEDRTAEDIEHSNFVRSF